MWAMSFVAEAKQKPPEKSSGFRRQEQDQN